MPALTQSSRAATNSSCESGGVVRPAPGLQAPEQRLLALGHKRRIAIEVPYFTAAIRSVAGTDLVATVPRRLAEFHRGNPAVRMVHAPPELKGFRYLMIWHPRLDADAAHSWLRSMVQAAGEGLLLSEIDKHRLKRS